jgi:choline dehydrogenase-like flavoprotein
MFVDARSLPDGEALDADIAIVGAGAAGLSLAIALEGAGLKVALIESGGLEWSEEAQDLAAGELGPQTYATPETVRLRYFGGTTGHWGGWCRELDAVDFEARAFVPLSGWPITKDALTPWYARAQEILHLGPQRYSDSEAVAAASNVRLPIPRTSDIEPVLFEFSPPIRMGEVYRSLIEKSDTRCFLNATVSDIRMSDDATRVNTLVISRDGAKPLTLAARHVVLACGGLSNAQMLLNADTQVAGGIGNGRDQVGRYFTDHPILIGYAAVMSLGPEAGGPFATGDISSGGRRYRLTFQPREDYRRAKGRLSCLATIEPPGPGFSGGAFDRWDARWFGPEETAAALGAFGRPGWTPRVHMLNAGIETRPNADSRVTLTANRDRHGVRRLKVDWKLNDTDFDDYLANLADLGRAMAASGAGLVRIAPDARERYPVETNWGHHNLGTTRMGEDAATSVCDGDARVHGFANLWIAGSSLYTTPGAANPTLTLVALALRLADRLKREPPA